MPTEVSDSMADIGTVIEHHSDGVPQGFNPHAIGGPINFYNDINGTPNTIEQSRLTPELVRESQQLAGKVPINTKGKEPIEVQRERAAVQMNIIARLLERRQKEAAVAVGELHSSQEPTPPVAAATTATSGFSARRRAAAASPTSPPRAVVTVKFKLPGFGEITAHYAAVLRQGNLVVLVHDTAAAPGDVFRPEASDSEDSSPPVQMQVSAEEGFFPVYATSIVFRHDSVEYCVLLSDD